MAFGFPWSRTKSKAKIHSPTSTPSDDSARTMSIKKKISSNGRPLKKTEEIDRLQHELADVKEQADKDREDLRTRLQAAYCDVTTARETNEELKSTKVALEVLKVSLEKEMQELKEVNKSEVAELREQLEYEQRLRMEDRRLLARQAEQLEDLQATDTISINDIVSMTEHLNEDIYHTANAIAEAPTFAERYSLPKEMLEYAEHWLGKAVVRLLYKAQKRNHVQRMFLVRSVTQAALVQACLGVMLAWDAVLKDSKDTGGVYNKIREGSSQAIAARWRAMTRAHTKYASPPVVEKAALARLVHGLGVVLTVAGWQPTDLDPETDISNWDAFMRVVERKFYGDVMGIVKSVIRVDRAIGEGMLGHDAGLVTIAGGEMFEATFMDELRIDEGDDQKEDMKEMVVLCTCDFGVQTDMRGGPGEEVVTDLPLKPKVLIVASLISSH